MNIWTIVEENILPLSRIFLWKQIEFLKNRKLWPYLVKTVNNPKMVHHLWSINKFSSNASSKIGDFSELSIEKTRNKKIGYPWTTTSIPQSQWISTDEKHFTKLCYSTNRNLFIDNGMFQKWNEFNKRSNWIDEKRMFYRRKLIPNVCFIKQKWDQNP